MVDIELKTGNHLLSFWASSFYLFRRQLHYFSFPCTCLYLSASCDVLSVLLHLWTALASVTLLLTAGKAFFEWSWLGMTLRGLRDYSSSLSANSPTMLPQGLLFPCLWHYFPKKKEKSFRTDFPSGSRQRRSFVMSIRVVGRYVIV